MDLMLSWITNFERQMKDFSSHNLTLGRQWLEKDVHNYLDIHTILVLGGLSGHNYNNNQ